MDIRWSARHNLGVGGGHVAKFGAGVLVGLALCVGGVRGQDGEQRGTGMDGVGGSGGEVVAREELTRRWCVVRFKDGRTLRAVYLGEDDARVDVEISGVETGFDREEIAAVEIEPPVGIQYRQLRAAIADDSADQLVNLARWLHAHELYDEALVELDTALAAEPDHPEAQRLRVVVQLQRDLARNRIGREVDEEGVERRERVAFPLLSDDQVNILKVYEIDLRDPPNFRVTPETRARVLEAYASDDRVPDNADARAALMRLSHREFLELMYRLRAREFYHEVEVIGQPAAFKRFRDDVQARWLVTSCASYRCHGGQQAGRLWLATERPRADNTWATNLLILDRTTLDDGTPLLDWEDPTASPLFQLALPRSVSSHPHPEVIVRGNEKGWRPVFRSPDDRGFRKSVDWMRSMFRPHPAYPITYEPPMPSGYMPPLEEDEEVLDGLGEEGEGPRVPR